MTLRLVKSYGKKYPRPCMDITIGFNTYPAFVNQATDQTTINIEVLEHLNSLREEINLPPITFPNLIEATLKRRDHQVTLELEIKENQVEHVILGNDFMMEKGFNLSIDGIQVHENSAVLDSPNTIDFIYNHDQGIAVKQWMQENDRPMYQKYERGAEPSLQMEPFVVINNDLAQHNDQEEDNEDADVLQLHAENEDLDFS